MFGEYCAASERVILSAVWRLAGLEPRPSIIEGLGQDVDGFWGQRDPELFDKAAHCTPHPRWRRQSYINCKSHNSPRLQEMSRAAEPGVCLLT
jgi:hypothetical protein